MNRKIAIGVAAGALVLGAIGATTSLPRLALAADPSAAATSAGATTTTPSTSSPAADPGVNHGGPGGLDADDLTAAAGALGMTEADLTTALQTQTVAAVAQAKGVDIQKVIDAIVASDTAEINAAVKAGTMTQAQADQRLANLTAHVTAEVNGTAGGRGGHGHGHGPGDGDGPAAPSSTSSGSASSNS